MDRDGFGSAVEMLGCAADGTYVSLYTRECRLLGWSCDEEYVARGRMVDDRRSVRDIDRYSPPTG